MLKLDFSNLFLINLNKFKIIKRFIFNNNKDTIKINNINNNHLKFLNEALIGLLLGDGSLIKNYQGGGTYFKFAQSVKHKRYIEYVFSLFITAELCNMKKLSNGKIKNKKNNKIYNYLAFSTKSLVLWNSLHKLWYNKNKKIVPYNIYDILTPIGLAFWF